MCDCKSPSINDKISMSVACKKNAWKVKSHGDIERIVYWSLLEQSSFHRAVSSAAAYVQRPPLEAGLNPAPRAIIQVGNLQLSFIFIALFGLNPPLGFFFKPTLPTHLPWL